MGKNTPIDFKVSANSKMDFLGENVPFQITDIKFEDGQCFDEKEFYTNNNRTYALSFDSCNWNEAVLNELAQPKVVSPFEKVYFCVRNFLFKVKKIFYAVIDKIK